jgi:hypothetical protein
MGNIELFAISPFIQVTHPVLAHRSAFRIWLRKKQCEFSEVFQLGLAYHENSVGWNEARLLFNQYPEFFF